MITSKRAGILSRSAPYLLGLYCLAVLLFFLAELKLFGLDEHLRATNQVLILFALLLLPFVVINMPGFVQSLTLKVSDKEFHIQLHELEQSITGNIGKVERQVSTAEQSLWPILAGEDVLSETRLAAPHRRLIIGSKMDTSQLFFTQLLAQCIEQSIPDITCEIRYPNGGSLRNFADVKLRWIDLYVDYTGTCSQYFNIAHKTADGKLKSDVQICEELNAYGEHIGVKWLMPLGCSEDYCIGVAPQTAEQHKIKSLRDLIRVAPKLTFAADPEFLNRKDCYLGMKDYGIRFKQVLPCHINERYAALDSAEAEVFVSYESDPEIIDERVVRLTDPNGFFPRYMAVPVIGQTTLKRIPELEGAINKLANRISTDTLNNVVQELVKANSSEWYAKDEAKRILENS